MQSQRNAGHYTDSELREMGFAGIGKNVLISRLARIYGASKMSLGDNIRIDDFVILSGKITIGSFVHIGAFASITGGSAGVSIGDFCGMSSQSKIFALSDDFTSGYLIGPCVPADFRNVRKKPVVLTRHCYIGSHSLVLAGSVFEMGACLGAMSHAIGRKLKPWSFYLGNPAKKLYDIPAQKVLALEAQLLEQISGGGGNPKTLKPHKLHQLEQNHPKLPHHPITDIPPYYLTPLGSCLHRVTSPTKSKSSRIRQSA